MKKKQKKIYGKVQTDAKKHGRNGKESCIINLPYI